MIFEAFSGSKYLIFENTTFVASSGSIAFWVFSIFVLLGFGFSLLRVRSERVLGLRESVGFEI